jgi:ATP-dependent DNA ligase
VFDGELVAIAEREGRPAQDFAAVTRAVFAGEARGARLQFVAFDILRHSGEDVRPLSWRERDMRLRQALPVGDRIRLISSQPATLEAHAAIVALGFEGSVLKRPGSTYRPGRHSSWIKHKARCSTPGILLAVYQARDGTWQATCEVEGRRVRALAGARARALAGFGGRPRLLACRR